MSAKRIEQLRKKITAANLDGLIVTNLDQVRYLSGYTGSAGLLVLAGGRPDFFTDFRYTDQAKKQVKGARVNIVTGGLLQSLADMPKLNKSNFRYGFNAATIPVGQLHQLKKALPDCLFVNADDIMSDLGWVKDKNEIALISKAAEISDIAFERVLNLIVPGVIERELAAELEYQMMMLGSDKPVFETIVASGYRSAMPHGIATDKKLKKGDFVTFDFGACYQGYVSDMTRTIVVGRATSRQKKVYNTVLKAQKAGIRKVKAGVDAKAVDDACRRLITKAGYGKNFGHGTGHGIGIVVHTGPNVGPKSKDKLLVNNVITIEPGIYISGWGGVRIEDDVVVTRTGGRVLNASPKKLLEL